MTLIWLPDTMIPDTLKRVTYHRSRALVKGRGGRRVGAMSDFLQAKVLLAPALSKINLVRRWQKGIVMMMLYDSVMCCTVCTIHLPKCAFEITVNINVADIYTFEYD